MCLQILSSIHASSSFNANIYESAFSAFLRLRRLDNPEYNLIDKYKAFSWGIIPTNIFSQWYGNWNLEKQGSDGWGFRKIIAIPSGLWNLLGAIITLAIKVFFIDLPWSLYQENLSALEKGTAQALRRLEFSIGRFVSLFDDETGCYLMGEANLALVQLSLHYETKTDSNLNVAGLPAREV